MKNYIITIARTYGSGGKTVGKMLADELGIKYYDREILRLASDESGISEALFGAADEKVSSASLSSLFRISKKTVLGEPLPPDSDDFSSNENLFNYQSKIIKSIADEESCVIIGRCADYVLKDYKNAIRIFCYAPEEACIKRDMDLNGHSRKESAKLIAEKDKNRGDYYKYYTGKQWDSATNYDMCINTASLDYEEILTIVKSFVDVVNSRD
ncbi:MAG: cytidylate kinase-like family protein [Eubacteriales bacterium]